MFHGPHLALQTTVSPCSLIPCLVHAPRALSPQQHSHRVAMETAERHTSRVRDWERNGDNEGQGERAREKGDMKDRLLAWRGWRRSPMEALVNFHIHKKNKEMILGARVKGWFRYASCRLNFFSSMCLLTIPLLSCNIHSPFPFLKSQSFCVNSKGERFKSTCRGARHSRHRPWERQWRDGLEKYRS